MKEGTEVLLQSNFLPKASVMAESNVREGITSEL